MRVMGKLAVLLELIGVDWQEVETSYETINKSLFHYIGSFTVINIMQRCLDLDVHEEKK